MYMHMRFCSQRTCEARQMNVQAVVVLHLKLIHHQGPVDREAVGLASLHRQTVELDGWKPEAVGRWVVAKDNSGPRRVDPGLLRACEVRLGLAPVVDGILYLARNQRSHTRQQEGKPLVKKKNNA